VYINNICFLKHFKKQEFLVYIVHLLDKYNTILQNAQYIYQENAGIS
jgi:GTPase involved in cell partitioning and DNA repair